MLVVVLTIVAATAFIAFAHARSNPQGPRDSGSATSGDTCSSFSSGDDCGSDGGGGGDGDGGGGD